LKKNLYTPCAGEFASRQSTAGGKQLLPWKVPEPAPDRVKGWWSKVKLHAGWRSAEVDRTET